MSASPRFPSTISAVIAAGVHLFPFRTEKLSPSAPMVLGPQGPGRVGRRRFLTDGPPVGGPFSLRASAGRAPARADTCTPAPPPRAGRHAHEPCAPAGGPCAGAAAPQGPRRGCPRRFPSASAPPPGRARPDRPPSRRRGRPRAAGTSGPGRAPCALGVPVDGWNAGGTCVRTIDPGGDGTARMPVRWACEPRHDLLIGHRRAKTTLARMQGKLRRRTVRARSGRSGRAAGSSGEHLLR